MEQIEKLNEVWYVFAGLALVMALGAYFIHRRLLASQSIKADFSTASSRHPVSRSTNKKLRSHFDGSNLLEKGEGRDEGGSAGKRRLTSDAQ